MLAGRDSAAVAGLDYAGSVRSDGWARLPMVRMTNVGLEPGPHTLEEIIAATDDGIYMETNRSWSIDDKRLNFQFGCEVGYEVQNGQLGRMLRNPTYTGIGPQFWRSMDMLSSEIVPWGTPELRQGPAGPGRPHRPPGGPGPLPQRACRGAGVSERGELRPASERQSRTAMGFGAQRPGVAVKDSPRRSSSGCGRRSRRRRSRSPSTVTGWRSPGSPTR